MKPMTSEAVRAALGPDTWAKAVSYMEQNRVQILSIETQGELITLRADVQGTRPRPYSVVATFRPSSVHPGGFALKGACSCPVSWNCKHVGALLLAHARGQAAPDGLGQDLRAWLEEIDNDASREEGAYAATVRDRLTYVLCVEGAPSRLLACLKVVRLDRRGEPAPVGRDYDPHAVSHAAPARFLRRSDLAIFPQLGRQVWTPALSGYPVRSARLLEAILATGRARLDSLDGPELRLGEPLSARVAWAVEGDATQRPHFEAEGRRLRVLPVLPPAGVDPDSGSVRPLVTGLPDDLAFALACAPPVKPSEVKALGAELEQRFAATGAVLPRPLSLEVNDETPPLTGRARLGLRTFRLRQPRWDADQRAYVSSRQIAVLEPGFDYGGLLFWGDDQRREAAFRTGDGAGGDRIVRVRRRPDEERQLLERLSAMGPRTLSAKDGVMVAPSMAHLLALGGEAQPIDYVGFLTQAAPVLEAEGWIISQEDGLGLKLARLGGEPWALAPMQAPGPGKAGASQDRLGLRVGVDDGVEDIMPGLIALLAKLPADPDAARQALDRLGGADGGLLLVELEDGRTLPLPAQRAIGILNALIDVWGVRPSADANLLADWNAPALRAIGERAGIGAGLEWEGLDRLRSVASALDGRGREDAVSPPPGFMAQLRPYQREGVAWLQMLSRLGFGALLADDMGLGKTVQTLAHITIEKAAGRLEGPVLIVAPKSVLPNWVAEAKRHAPDLACAMISGSDRARVLEDLSDLDLVVTSYPVLVRDRQVLLEQAWGMVVLDEAQMIRNPETAAAKAAFGLQARHRIALSGTPVENHLGDVWSLMHFLNPGLLGDARGFRQDFRLPIEKRSDARAQERLSRRLSPFLMRRTKDEVAGDLPARTDILQRIELSEAQRDIYEGVRLVMETKVRKALDDKGMGRASILVLDALLKLRQAACDPRLVKGLKAKEAKSVASAKLERLIELLQDLVSEGRRVLVFSQFVEMLELIRSACEERNWPLAWLTGATEDRAKPVADFQEGRCPIFLISLKAGGVGLNLTAADTVILYDPWWNPAAEAQAIDRAHRIGQDKPVFVHRLIAADTVEERVLALQETKRGLADALLAGEPSGLSGLNETELLELFG